MNFMDYKKISEKVRVIREQQFNVSQEKFSEVLNTSPASVKRAERPSGRVSNVEFYVSLSLLSGISLDELLLDKKEVPEKNRLIKKINYMLNHVTNDELEYLYIMIDNYMKFHHKDEYRVLKSFKKYMK